MYATINHTPKMHERKNRIPEAPDTPKGDPQFTFPWQEGDCPLIIVEPDISHCAEMRFMRDPSRGGGRKRKSSSDRAIDDEKRLQVFGLARPRQNSRKP